MSLRLEYIVNDHVCFFKLKYYVSYLLDFISSISYTSVSAYKTLIPRFCKYVTLHTFIQTQANQTIMLRSYTYLNTSFTLLCISDRLKYVVFVHTRAFITGASVLLDVSYVHDMHARNQPIVCVYT